MRIERTRSLNRLISNRGNGQIKIITGIRRCGKSYLLQTGVPADQIITLELDNDLNAR